VNTFNESFIHRGESVALQTLLQKRLHFTTRSPCAEGSAVVILGTQEAPGDSMLCASTPAIVGGYNGCGSFAARHRAQDPRELCGPPKLSQQETLQQACCKVNIAERLLQARHTQVPADNLKLSHDLLHTIRELREAAPLELARPIGIQGARVLGTPA
jgi:hypothetical protein